MMNTDRQCWRGVNMRVKQIQYNKFTILFSTDVYNSGHMAGYNWVEIRIFHPNDTKTENPLFIRAEKGLGSDAVVNLVETLTVSAQKFIDSYIKTHNTLTELGFK
jgi:hypothetical protein